MISTHIIFFPKVLYPMKLFLNWCSPYGNLCFSLYSPIFNTLNLITLIKSFSSIPVFIQTSLLKVLIYGVEYHEVIIVSVTVIHKLHHIQCNILLLNIQFVSYNTLSPQPKFYSPILHNKCCPVPWSDPAF